MRSESSAPEQCHLHPRMLSGCDLLGIGSAAAAVTENQIL